MSDSFTATAPSEWEAAAGDGAHDRPLCVDLDGTLIKSDTLVDSLLLLVRAEPLALLHLPGWIARGKATLKAEVARRVALNVEHLPYNRPLLGYLEQQHGRKRRLFLATGADLSLATRVAEHTGLFEGVLASDGQTNLTGNNKLESFRRHFASGFDYIGNARPDITLLEAATQAMVANPDGALSSAIRAGKIRVERRFDDRAPLLKSLRRALRLHQWAKNTLIFLPLILAHALRPDALLEASLAFLCFSLCASATYILNDLLDIEADRRHPRKRYRPFASGDLTAKTGALISISFLACSFATALLLLPLGFLAYLGLYLVTTLAYSLYFKRVVLVDVMLLSGLYTLRMLAGAKAEQVFISPWLAGFSIFLFLSLAMVKRFSELQNLRTAGQAVSNGRGYMTSDIEQLRAFGTSSAYAAVVVFSFYISSVEVSRLYQHPKRLWLITPLLIFWLSRVWLLASRGELDEDPVIFAVTDRASLAIGVAVAIIALFAVL